MPKTSYKKKNLGNPMAMVAASQLVQNPPKINPLVIAGGLVLVGFVVWKISGVFGGVGKAVDAAGNVIQSGGNLVSSTIDTANKGIKTVATKVAEATGLKDSSNDIIVKNYIGTTTYKEAFNPNFYRNIPNTIFPKLLLIYKQAEAQAYAKQLYDAKGLLNDDEEKVFGVVQVMRSHAHLSQVCEVFFGTYQKGLYDYLKSFLDSNEMAQIIKMVDTLPSYRTT